MRMESMKALDEDGIYEGSCVPLRKGVGAKF